MRERLGELLCRPLRSGMRGYVEVSNAPARVFDDDEYVRDAKCHSGCHEEVDRGNVISVVHEPPARKPRQL
jgi:hypothetical protein